MSDRLSKLGEYLQDGNYEMAITMYSENPQPLTDSQTLELARAFLVNEQFQKCKDICERLTHSNKPSILYESSLLLIKAKYLLGESIDKMLNQLIEDVQKLRNQFCQYHLDILLQIQQNFSKQELNSRMSTLNPSQIKTHANEFVDLLERQQMDNPLSEGMPMFLISARWYENWERFAGIRSGVSENPGIITHFEIIDHHYNTVYDPTLQKKYTNYLIYPTSRVKIISKKCWLHLTKYYFGFELKRYNMWVLGKPREIFTEVHLKRIQVKKNNEDFVYQVQISKKESWGGLAKKLSQAWKFNGFLYEQKNERLVSVKENVNLEEVDTIGRCYRYCQKEVNTASTVFKVNNYCQNCKSTKNLKFCQCKLVKYCSMECLKEDRENHKKKCEIECTHIKQKAAVLDNFQLAEREYGGKKGLVGLRNLGNTCYMNSGLQCMSNTKQITEYFMSNQFLKQINHSNPLGTKGNLACAYAELIRQMWSGNESAISPYNLKKIIGKFAGQFSGYGQQDSQEFISYLIDGLCEDLNMVKKKQVFETSDEVMPDEEASLQSEINYAKRIQSYIRNLMVGQFKSTVICSKCSRVSICFDPYLLLSLPIPSLSKQKQLYFVWMDPNEKPIRIYFYFDSENTVGDLRQNLSSFLSIGEKKRNFLRFMEVSLVTMEIYEFDIKDQENLSDKLTAIEKASNVLMAYEFVEPIEDQVRCRIDYYYNKDKICYPRFMNFPASISSSNLAEKILPSVERYAKNSRLQGQQLYQQLPIIKNNSQIAVELREGLKMLTCRTQEQKLKFFKEQRLTLSSCLKNFTCSEILEDKNEWYCNKCKSFVRASKQMEIYKANKILVIAFKRFNRGWKIKSPIEFPVQNLDMGPYIKSNKEQKKIIYDLYGVVNHQGTMGGGHYTAYCKNFLNSRWYEFDDSRVSQVNARSVVSERAYVVFYRRRSD